MTAHSDDYDPEYDLDSSEPQHSRRPPLPSLTATPTAHPGCCLGLSAPLVEHIHSLSAPSPLLTLSIGSGYGLLEALLLAMPRSHNVVGVEVQPSSNRYLPVSHHRTVPGTRFLEPLAAEATVWIFVYPRRVGLLEEYLATHGGGSVEKVIWAGPTADWEDYKGCFGREWSIHVRNADEVGGRGWEVIAVATKRST